MSVSIAPRAHLSSWIDEHLAHQRADGSLNDWVAAGEVSRFKADAPEAVQVFGAAGIVISADRNTSESDQEASAVIAAGEVFRITGDRAWLTRGIVGRRLVDRLDAALEFVRARRFDPVKTDTPLCRRLSTASRTPSRRTAIHPCRRRS